MPRVQYSAQEYCNMHFLYGECGGNASAAAALYRERYPNARHPDYRVFIRVHSCYLEGRIPGRGLGGTSEGRPQLIDAQDIVLNKVAEDSTISVRDIARREGIAKSTVHRILKRRKFHPYHVTRVQTLQPRDFAARVTFCRLIAMGGRRENNARIKAARPLCVEHATGNQPLVEHSLYVAGPGSGVEVDSAAPEHAKHEGKLRPRTARCRRNR
ncbi:hypothetical protein OBRU01_02534 [Operophtera brumata]|uniref:DUF4817 domain-containing protein n=1 Tax=Operophtera brumata TaxID=104452 RepID=A0A0L7LQK9_OPEBR|nr:hypothetical protein OBRU01_02534 [Operophtera brumata]